MVLSVNINSPVAPQSPHTSVCSRDLLRDILLAEMRLLEVEGVALSLSLASTSGAINNFLCASIMLLAKHIHAFFP